MTSYSRCKSNILWTIKTFNFRMGGYDFMTSRVFFLFRISLNNLRSFSQLAEIVNDFKSRSSIYLRFNAFLTGNSWKLLLKKLVFCLLFISDE